MNTPETHHTDDLVLLEGPHSRRRELWLVLRAVRDFIAGFRALHFVGPCVRDDQQAYIASVNQASRPRPAVRP